MKDYLLDTNICIYIIKNKSAHVVENIKKLHVHQVKISAITLAELEYGVSKSKYRDKNHSALIRFVSAFDIIDFNDSDAEVFGMIRAHLEKVGQVIGPYDMQIAAQALSRDIVLVTKNISEFSRVPKLKIENWV